MVLIPTIGRGSLNVIIQQILHDAVLSNVDITIFVALNGTLDPKVRIPPNVQVLQISSVPIGLSDCVNISLAKIPSGYLWTIADDDEWLLGKFTCDLNYLGKLSDKRSLLLPRVYLNDSVGRAVRPKATIEGENIRDYLYGHISLARNPRYVTMSGACAHTDFWARVEFPVMPVREDVVYLMAQEKLGIRFIQPYKPTVKINIDFKRGLSRDTDIHAVLAWQKSFLNKEHAIGFLACAWPKPFAASGKSEKIRDLRSQLNRQSLPSINLFTLTAIKLLLTYWIFLARVINKTLK